MIDINDKTKDKKLKTLHSKRIVPLHQTLIDLGFLDYIKILEQNGKERKYAGAGLAWAIPVLGTVDSSVGETVNFSFGSTIESSFGGTGKYKKRRK